MVRAFVAGVAGASSLARQHGVALRVLDLGVDDDLADLPPEVSAYHIGPSQPIHLSDALTPEECTQALFVGRAIAEAEIAAGADLAERGRCRVGARRQPLPLRLACPGRARGDGGLRAGRLT